MRYSSERKAAMLRKALPPHNRSIRSLAEEKGISESTLYNRRKQGRAQGRILPDALGRAALTTRPAATEAAPLASEPLVVYRYPAHSSLLGGRTSIFHALGNARRTYGRSSGARNGMTGQRKSFSHWRGRACHWD